MVEQHQRSRGTGKLTLQDILFVGFKSHVVALDRYNGEILWSWTAPKGHGAYVAILLDDDRLMVSVQGYTYCLDPLDGQMLWQNPLKGYGLGIPSLASVHGNSSSAAAAAIMASQQQAGTGGAPAGT